MFSAAVGHSEDTDATAVANELADRCRAQLGEASPKAGLLFAAIDLDHQGLLVQLDRRGHGLALIGWTPAGWRSAGMGTGVCTANLCVLPRHNVTYPTGIITPTQHKL